MAEVRGGPTPPVAQQVAQIADLIPVVKPVMLGQEGVGDANQEAEASAHRGRDKPPVIDVDRSAGPQEMERIFQVMECDANTKLLYAVYMLQGDAADWWTMLDTHLSAKVMLSLGHCLRDIFSRSTSLKKLGKRREMNLKTLKQGNMTVDEYLSKFNRLAKYSCYGRAPLTPKDKAFRFKKGLNDMIADKLDGHCTRDFVELIKQCQNIQEYYRTKGKDGTRKSYSSSTTHRKGKGKGLQVNQNNKFKKIGNVKNESGKAGTGKIGHFSRECPQRKGQVVAIQAVLTPIVIEEPPAPTSARVYAITQQEAGRATHSFISAFVANGLHLPIHEFTPPMVVKTATGDIVSTSLVCKEVRFKLEKEEKIFFSAKGEKLDSLYLSIPQLKKALNEGDAGYIILGGLVRASKEPTSNIHVVCEFEDVFPEEVPQFPPLTYCLINSKGVPFAWTLGCEVSFQELKDKLTITPILILPDPEGRFEIFRDASKYEFGCVLM
ncbi:uncharacterized protein LOC133308512 [Gastrolobium bilobum]|uniref:uncharacterized protein LOC133308512 n=1 Tax=Gastrolobium bilobum TaxID=150636 RepID=UPI002AB31DC5|nr:uncharacterized protein LOC133308512 [Gastrolobium bilobum]